MKKYILFLIVTISFATMSQAQTVQGNPTKDQIIKRRTSVITEQLSLTKDQQKKVETYVKQSMDKGKTSDENEDQLLNDKIIKILTPAQLEKYNAIQDAQMQRNKTNIVKEANVDNSAQKSTDTQRIYSTDKNSKKYQKPTSND